MTKLKEYRLAKGLTTTDLAKIVGISRPHMSRLENNKMKITAETAVRIEKLLGISRADLRPDLFIISGVAHD